MIYLTYLDKIFEYSENILKISTYLENIAKDRSYENEPLPLLRCTHDIFKIFNDWFNVIERTYIKDGDEYIVFYSQIFTNYDNNVLIDIFNFGFANQIRLLCETVAYVIARREINLYMFDEKVYISGDLKMVNEKVYIETLYLHQSLAMIILKHMTRPIFNKQPDEIKKLIDFPVNVEDKYKKHNDFQLVVKLLDGEKDIEYLKLVYKIWKNELYQNIPDFHNIAYQYKFIDETDFEYEFGEEELEKTSEPKFNEHVLTLYGDINPENSLQYYVKLDEITFMDIINMFKGYYGKEECMNIINNEM